MIERSLLVLQKNARANWREAADIAWTLRSTSAVHHARLREERTLRKLNFWDKALESYLEWRDQHG